MTEIISESVHILHTFIVCSQLKKLIKNSSIVCITKLVNKFDFQRQKKKSLTIFKSIFRFQKFI